MGKIRTLQIPLTEEEYQKLLNLKGEKSWRDWLLDKVEILEAEK